MKLINRRQMTVDIAHFARDSRNHPLLDAIEHLTIEEKHVIILGHMQVIASHAAWKNKKMPASLSMKGNFRTPPAIKRMTKLAKALKRKWNL